MILPYRRYATFSGRSRRREFWMFQLFNVLVGIVLFAAASAFAPTERSSTFASGDGAFNASASFNSDLSGSPVSMLLMSVWGLFVLASVIPGIAVAVRRFHDQDKSGWWYLVLMIFSIIPLLGLIPLIALIVFMTVSGTPGPNRYGPDPKNPYDETVFA
jgi:uncharacterized membrane protein YhaH (DUF805 family)